MTLQQRLRGRPAHAPGPTFLSYTPNGKKLITVGLNNAIRVFQTGSDAEPTNIDDCQDNNSAVVASNDFFITGSEDGTVCKYSLETNSFQGILTRFSAPVRDLALSPDGNWVAVGGDELVVKVVNIQDMEKVIFLREQPKFVKHVAFDHSGSYLAVSCADGKIYVYSLTSEQPELIKKLDGLIKAMETDVEASSRVIWHPDGRAFATPTPTREVQVISRSDWERQRVFKTPHTGDITSAAWSPNGAILATTSGDRKLILWDTKSQTIIKTYDDIRATILAMSWHPTQNILSYTNNDGELFIHTDIVPSESIPLLERTLQPAPFIHDPLSEESGAGRRSLFNGIEKVPIRPRRGSSASLDDIIGSDIMSTGDGFIEDDDGAGYAEEVNGHGKRTNSHLGALDARIGKRRNFSEWHPQVHPSFQPGSTPWRGNRRYLCLNLTGFVWTVDQDTHHTVTVEFYDREFHRDYHFTDPFLYDKACLNDHGALFSCPPSDMHPATVYYRPHETWTTRTDWRTQLPPGEKITAMALSDSYIVITTSTNYVRIFTLFGVPFRVYRQKSAPSVTCAAWRDYVLTIGNGPIGGDGRTQLLYTIENVKRDEICQNEDLVALPEGAELQSVFFSDTGDPCIYDTHGVLLTLLHWRTPSQARWTPLLDTRLLSRLSSGRKTESYWPVAVAQQKFHCIILKGGDKYPYFPRPLLSDFDFKVPISAPPKPKSDENGEDDEMTDRDGNNGDGENEQSKLEELYLRSTLLHALLIDTVAATRSTASQRAELARRELDIDKALLQLLAVECREGEERGMKALEIVGLMQDRSGKMLEAAGKVAARFGRDVLGEKIREVAERRLVGLDDETE